MTDSDHKTVRNAPAGGTGPAGATGAPAPKHAASDEKEPFDPFKFQSITMPPGLRGELIEEARNRPAEPARVDTPPPEETSRPDDGMTLNGGTGDDVATIRLAKQLDTERLPRVRFAREQERRRRIAIGVVGVLAAFVGFAAVWSQQTPVGVDTTTRLPESMRAPPSPITNAAPAVEPRPAVAAPAAQEMTPSAASEHAIAPAAPTEPPVTQPVPPSIRPSRESSAVPREPAASKPSARASNVPKPASPHPNGVDLLDFQGPAPKGP